MGTKATGGAEIPELGFGTYNLYGSACEQAVRDAIEIGYRHIDTAEFYDNHVPVGKGINAASVPRDQIFLTTKVWKTNLEPDSVREMVRTALDDLEMEYIDLLLVHWPNQAVPIEDTIRAMNELQREETVVHIGVSNFSVSQLSAAIEASQTPIVTNQVEYHPGRSRPELGRFAIEADVLITAYSPLDKGDVLDEQLLASIGDAYGKSPAQVALRWLIQQPNVLAIPKAASREHRYENYQIHDFELTDAEMVRIFELAGTVEPDMAAALGLDPDPS